MQLHLLVTFANGRYHGHDNENELEFPPSPSRLFQALIAGSHCGAYRVIHQEERDRALQWLEALEPPTIEAPSVKETGRGITNYVPNNDNQLNHIRTAKSFLAHVFTEKPVLIYRWRFAGSQEAEEHAAVICAIARLVTHLGQHQDTVYVQGELTDDLSTLEELNMKYPIERNDGQWTAPQAGALEAYQNRYQSWLRGEAKDNITIPARCVAYRPAKTLSLDAPLALYELWDRNGEDRLRYDPRDLRQPAAMVRHAMIEWIEAHPKFREHYGADLTARLIAGHEADKQHNGAHIACVPIPTMREEGEHDGLIRRVLLIGLGCEETNARELFDSVADGINGSALKDQGVKRESLQRGRRCVSLDEAAIKDKTVGYLKKTSLNDSVQRLFTSKAYRVWRTVTPIILTGLMRRGRGAEALLMRALKQAGFDENDIESVAAFSGPIVPKSFHALDYCIDEKSYLAQTPRYHAEVIFKRPVEGALVVGRGRHCGFGLMIPCLENPPNFLQ